MPKLDDIVPFHSIPISKSKKKVKKQSSKKTNKQTIKQKKFTVVTVTEWESFYR